ncbi:MAG: hypothetical protein HYV03_02300 [Deltaproteobacteria bacterium]|nr:hypothetical protein [Deltaproteobacteria bacterium]
MADTPQDTESTQTTIYQELAGEPAPPPLIPTEATEGVSPATVAPRETVTERLPVEAVKASTSSRQVSRSRSHKKSGAARTPRWQESNEIAGHEAVDLLDALAAAWQRRGDNLWHRAINMAVCVVVLGLIYAAYHAGRTTQVLPVPTLPETVASPAPTQLPTAEEAPVSQTAPETVAEPAPVEPSATATVELPERAEPPPEVNTETVTVELREPEPASSSVVKKVRRRPAPAPKVKISVSALPELRGPVPFNSGGPEDLDNDAARKKYLELNQQKRAAR